MRRPAAVSGTGSSSTSLPIRLRWPRAPGSQERCRAEGRDQVRTDFGVPGYGGPCPPKGDKPHHYIFTIYAVDVDKLDADQNTTAAVVGFNLHFHTLEKASLTALYGR